MKLDQPAQRELVGTIGLPQTWIDESAKGHPSMPSGIFQTVSGKFISSAVDCSQRSGAISMLCFVAISETTCMEPENLELSPFNQHGGLGKAHQLFGGQLATLLDELNEVLAA